MDEVLVIDFERDLFLELGKGPPVHVTGDAWMLWKNVFAARVKDVWSARGENYTDEQLSAEALRLTACSAVLFTMMNPDKAQETAVQAVLQPLGPGMAQSQDHLPWILPLEVNELGVVVDATELVRIVSPEELGLGGSRGEVLH